MVCASLKIYKLRVKLYNNKGDEVLKYSDVVMYHFSGWPDLDNPSSKDELEGFNTLIQALATFYVSALPGEDEPKAVMHCR